MPRVIPSILACQRVTKRGPIWRDQAKPEGRESSTSVIEASISCGLFVRMGDGIGLPFKSRTAARPVTAPEPICRQWGASASCPCDGR